MKTKLFSPILILLMLTLLAKASMLFGRIQEQTTNSNDTTTTSVLVDSAYAKSSEAEEKPAAAKPEVEHATLLPEELEKKISSNPPKDTVGSNVVSNLTRSEIDLLKELSKRREQIEKEKKDITLRQQVLQATESKIDQKFVEMKNLQTNLEELMKQYDQKENSKILSLVKIYENMPIKDAAVIFNDLEMPVLLKVVSNMKEVKVAPIIAKMDPGKARELSIEIAKQKPIN